MLRLCPGDNLGQRSCLGSILIRIGRFDDALHFAQCWLSDAVSDTGIPPIRGGTAFKPPSRDLINATREKSLSKSGSGAALYTAALASFKLFGNCEQSQQYIRMAAKANPHVLLKILACVRQPGIELLTKRIIFFSCNLSAFFFLFFFFFFLHPS